jgi:DNA-binding XRE family transcriptional regulator
MTIMKDKPKRQQLRQELYQKLDSRGVPISETVKSLRKILAKDQATFSEEVGVAISTLRKIEQENGNISLDIIYRILDRYSLELVVVSKRK